VYSRAAVSEKKGDFDTAISDYTAAIKLHPGYSAAYNKRGNAYRAIGDKKKRLRTTSARSP
jgi:tetratricopeptide (TPR) repeat protein